MLLLTSEQMEQIDDPEEWTQKVQSPLQHIEHVLQGWVAYPSHSSFCLFQCGVAFSSGIDPDLPLNHQPCTQSLPGKDHCGVTVFSYFGIRLKIPVCHWVYLWGRIAGTASCFAKVGFTMSVLIANLAFANAAVVLMDSARVRNPGWFNGIRCSGYLMLEVLPSGERSDT
ncbi:MAG: Na+/H+ antiporter NhaA [Bacteroidales bacterium]|nr:Na+/H+ antiporter NhaA [Bacteroidales bacterium]